MSRDFQQSFAIGEVVADRVVAFELVRELGKPATLDIEVQFSEDATADNAIGQEAYFTFGFEGEPAHEFAGVINAVTLVGTPALGGIGVISSGSAHRVRLSVVSQLHTISGIVTARILQDKDVKEIVELVLDDHGIKKDKQRWSLKGTYAKREYCVQYFESSLAFVSRLCEEEGIYFWQGVEDGSEVFYFADESPSASPIEGDADLPMRGLAGGVTDSDTIFGLREHAKTRSGKFVLRDYDFKRPSLDMTAEAEAEADTDLERYDYPGLYFEPSVGKHLAKVRLEAEQAERETIEMLVESPRLHAGFTITVSHVPSDDMAGDFLLTRVAHAYGRRVARHFRDFEVEVAREARELYIAVAQAIPKAVPFRSPQVTPRPIVHGPTTAKVVAPAGSQDEAIHTDEHGRCKVKFPWDLGPDQDDKASCWMRTGQLQTSGSMILPRIGWEVVVEYLEGNPDRPFVTGKLYNGLYMPPYSLPEGKTRTSMRTCSTPGGGGSNEIRLEDAAGIEEIMINAQYDQTITTANDKKRTVLNNSTRTVKASTSTIDVGAATGDDHRSATMAGYLLLQPGHPVGNGNGLQRRDQLNGQEQVDRCCATTR
ncbi:MAG: type VI secretion system tip protein TssI/VgrG [Polyangiaceae bacterium]